MVVLYIKRECFEITENLLFVYLARGMCVCVGVRVSPLMRVYVFAQIPPSKDAMEKSLELDTVCASQSHIIPSVRRTM